MDEKGLIGQVTYIGLTHAEVTLITGENQQIPVKIARNGVRTLSSGDGARGTLSLPFLPEGSDVQVGDQLVTSGIDGLYPEGLPVANVVRVDRSSSQQFASVVCTPVAGLTSAHYVLVIQNHREAIKP
jgi:rod shape-determining protein MreC